MGSSPPKPTEKEYGRRLYVSDLNYQGQIRKPTDKAFDDLYKLPHSENKKPYMEDDYGEMEYFQSPPFGFPWNFPDFDAPWAPPSQPWTPPWLLVFTCQVLGSPCFCDGGVEKCYSINCSHPIIEAFVDPLGDPSDPSMFSVTAGGSQICITGKTGADGAVRVNILMQADPGDGSIVYGEYGPILMYQCDDEDCGCDGTETPVAHDKTLSPATINRSDTVTVYITAGTAPYTWTITGTGLTLGSATTTGLTNTVTSSGSACGCGAITITDACGNIAYGGIRTVEASGWGGYTDPELVDWCALSRWADTQNAQACGHDCYRHQQYKRGGWHTDCPSCRCSNYTLTHSNSLADCSFNCTWQVGARSLGRCQISIQTYGCS